METWSTYLSIAASEAVRIQNLLDLDHHHFRDSIRQQLHAGGVLDLPLGRALESAAIPTRLFLSEFKFDLRYDLSVSRRHDLSIGLSPLNLSYCLAFGTSSQDVNRLQLEVHQHLHNACTPPSPAAPLSNVSLST